MKKTYLDVVKTEKIDPPRTLYGWARRRLPREATGLRFDSEKESDRSLTKQADMAACDINNIVKKFNATGQLPDLIKANPQFGEFADPFDFQESMNIVAHATQQFDALPSKVRERFHNDPQEFLTFASDGSNAEEMARLGLMRKDAVERVQKQKQELREKELDAEIAKRSKQQSASTKSEAEKK